MNLRLRYEPRVHDVIHVTWW